MEFPTIDKFAKEVAEKALDEITYEGKTVREWVEIIVKQQQNDSNISDPCDGCRYELNSTNGNPCYSCGKYKLTEQQPSVYPERPKGEWIEYEVDVAPHPLHCSLCGFSNHHISNRYMREFRRCPDCGADMSGGGEDDLKT